MAQYQISVGTGNVSGDTHKSRGLFIQPQGVSTRVRAEIVLSQPCLRQFKPDPNTGIKKETGDMLTGVEAGKIIATYLKANENRRLARFEHDLRTEAISPTYEVDERSLNGKTAAERANQYIFGKIFQALDACPRTFTVGDTEYRIDTVSMKKFANPGDLKEVLDGKKSIGTGTVISLYDETPQDNSHFIDEETFDKALKLVQDILKPALSGNTLTFNGHPCVTFVESISVASNVQVGVRVFDTSSKGLLK